MDGLYAPPPPPEYHLARARLVDPLRAELERGRTILIRAPAGHGKSCLAADLMSGWPDSCFLRVGPAEREPGALAALISLGLSTLHPGSDHEPRQDWESMEPARLPERLFAQIQIDRRTAGGRPPLIVLDELSEPLDQAHSFSLVERLVELSGPRLGLVLVLAQGSTPALARWRTAGRLYEVTADDLAFTAEEVEQLAEKWLEPLTPRTFAADLHRAAGGWPSLVVLCLYLLRTRGRLSCAATPPVARGGPGPAPGAEELLELVARPPVELGEAICSLLLDPLPEGLQRLLLSASIPDRIDTALLEDVFGSGPRDVLSLVERRLLRPCGAGHVGIPPLVRQVLRERFRLSAPDDYRTAHRSVARHLHARGAAAALVIEHFVEAGARDEAVRLLSKDGPTLIRTTSPWTLGSWLDRLLASGVASSALLWLRGRALMLQGDMPGASCDFTRAHAVAGTQGERVRALTGLAEVHRRRLELGRARACLARIGRNGPAPGEPPPAETLQARMIGGLLLMDEGALARATKELKKVLALAIGTDGGEALEARLENALGTVSMRQGDFRRARAHFQASADRYRRLDDRWGLAQARSNLGLVMMSLGDVSGARACLGEALELRERQADPWGIASTLMALGAVDRVEGRLDAARTQSARALEVACLLGDPALEIECTLSLVDTEVLACRLDQAAVRLDQAQAALGGLEKVPPRLEAFVAITRSAYALARGRPREAMEDVNRALSILQSVGLAFEVAEYHQLKALVARALDDRGLTQECLGRVARAALSEGYRFHDLLRYRVLWEEALQGADTKVREYARQVLDEHGRSRDPVVWAFTGGAWQSLSSALAAPVLERAARAGMVVDVRGATVTLLGQATSFSGKALLLALLVRLVRTYPEASSTDELCREVWQVRHPSAAARSRVKVAISRLRRLLPDGSRLVVTDRLTHSGPAGGGAYRLAVELALAVVE